MNDFQKIHALRQDVDLSKAKIDGFVARAQSHDERIKQLNRAVSKANAIEYYSGSDKTACKMASLLASGEIGLLLPSEEGFEAGMIKDMLDLLPETFVMAIDNFDRKEIHNAVNDGITDARLKILWDTWKSGIGWGTGLYVAYLKKTQL